MYSHRIIDVPAPFYRQSVHASQWIFINFIIYNRNELAVDEPKTDDAVDLPFSTPEISSNIFNKYSLLPQLVKWVFRSKQLESIKTTFVSLSLSTP